jgi:RNA polymerase sigma factor (sigma-70 family)
LEPEQDLILVGEADNGREAVELVREQNPDVVLMDISMPSLNGIEATRQIQREMANVKVIFLSFRDDEGYVREALRAGACGYVLKSSAYDELKQAIRAAMRDEVFLSPSISSLVVDGYLENLEIREDETAYECLTPRQREILQLLAEGNSRSEIAEILHISPKTVSRHRENLMHRLNVSDDASLIKYAIRLGLTSAH